MAGSVFCIYVVGLGFKDIFGVVSKRGEFKGRLEGWGLFRGWFVFGSIAVVCSFFLGWRRDFAFGVVNVLR